jgi:hypothetical protein
MSKDLLTQLADYGDYCEQRQGSVALDDITLRGPGLAGSRAAQIDSPIGPGRSETQEHSGSELPMFEFREHTETRAPAVGRRRIMTAAAAAAVMFVVGVLALVNRNGEDVPTGPAAAPTVAEPLATFEVVDPVRSPGFVAGAEYRWSRVPHSEEFFGEGFEQGMSSVTVGGPGLVAVGQAGSAVAKAAVWTSPDGITWSRTPGHETIFEGAVMSDVTAGGPGLVAVGSQSGDGSADDRAAVWTSVDGIAWSQVPHDEATFGGADMRSVAAGGPGLVAVGWDGHPQGDKSNAVVWTSPDGIAWSRVPHDEAIFGNTTGAWMWSVAAGGPGLVAVGDTDDGAAVWTSVDGLTWSRANHSEALSGYTAMRSVTAGGPGLVAVGTEWEDGYTNSDAAVWTSVDGLTWSRVPHDEAIFGGPIDQAMTSVTAGGVGLVAVGFDGVNGFSRTRVGDELDAAVWTSVDGITWSRAPHDEAVFGARPKPVLEISSITAGGPGLVAVGANRVYDTHGATEADAAVLVATFED